MRNQYVTPHVEDIQMDELMVDYLSVDVVSATDGGTIVDAD